MGRRSVATAAALTGVALTLGACGGGSEPSARPADPRTSAPAPDASSGSAPDGTPGAPAVPAALEFSAPALGGGRVVGADYASTGVALWFWAPW